MRSDSGSTFTARARREQLLAVTITTLATEGYGQTSLAKIAANAGVAKGVVSYHFAGKDALLETVVTSVYTGITERVLPQLAGLTGLELLRAHVLAVARDVIEHPDELTAVTEVITHLRGPDSTPRFGLHTNDHLYGGLEQVYRAGQSSGEMRPFDVRTMAILAQSGIDSMVQYCRRHPDRDLMAHAASLADLLVHAVAADPEETR